MHELTNSLLIDLAILAMVLLLTFRKLSYFHPFTWYLVFHSSAITWRAIELWQGSWPLYLDYKLLGLAKYSVIGANELIRALQYADIALVIFAAATLIVPTTFASQKNPAKMQVPTHPAMGELYLAPSFHRVMISAGLISIPVFAFVQSGLSDFESSQFLRIMITWPASILCAYIAATGFQRKFVVPLAIVLALVSTQGYHRFMLMLPIIFLMGAYLLRNDLRWPPIKAIPGIAFLVICFPLIKYFGKFIRGDDQYSLGRMFDSIFGSTYDPRISRTEMMLDQLAGALSNADRLPDWLYGESWAASILLPIPRSMWEDKPSLGESALSVATFDRPYDIEGRVVTLIGDFYINFGMPGILLGFAIFGLLLCYIYQRAFAKMGMTFEKILYLGLVGSLIQVFRDGLNSFVIFFVIVNLPLIAAIVIQRAMGNPDHQRDIPRQKFRRLRHS